jgi:nucleotide-binding universal stress UspA family protein
MGGSMTHTLAGITSDGSDDWHKIVVGYDGSEEAKRALARASRLGTERTRVVVVAVAEPYPRGGSPSRQTTTRLRSGDGDTNLMMPAGSCRSGGFWPRRFSCGGDAAESLFEASKDADLIVVGGSKLNRVQRLILRSVSSKVVRNAACDVLVVR